MAPQGTDRCMVLFKDGSVRLLQLPADDYVVAEMMSVHGVRAVLAKTEPPPDPSMAQARRSVRVVTSWRVKTLSPSRLWRGTRGRWGGASDWVHRHSRPTDARFPTVERGPRHASVRCEPSRGVGRSDSALRDLLAGKGARVAGSRRYLTRCAPP
jgi:hypothetical protein